MASGGEPVSTFRNRASSTASTDSTYSSSGRIGTNTSTPKKSGFFHSVKKSFSTSKHADVETVAYEVPGTPTNPELQGFSHGFTGMS